LILRIKYIVDMRIDWKEKRLLTETSWAMNKETIIFFDKLGFGWVLDNVTAKEMKLNRLKEEDTVNRSLIKILENLLDYTGA
jgi:hypothetical protein